MRKIISLVLVAAMLLCAMVITPAATDDILDAHNVKISAEYFVNATGRTSRTRYLIWVSTYTQHLYIFQGTKGNWKLIKDWECSTGAPWSPTPTGIFGKEIEGHESHDGRIPYWCNFQTANSIHGHRSSYTFGSPQSNGCVRNYNENAKWIYYNCDIGTAVVVY